MRGSEIHSYELDELLGTKLRALYHRAQGRDLFDLATALESGRANPERIVEAFSAYMKHGGHAITRQQFEKNLALKMQDAEFTADMGPQLTSGHEWDTITAAATISDRLIALLPDSKSARKRAARTRP